MKALTRLASKRVRPGDGRPLSRFRWWQLLAGRAVFSLILPGSDSHGTRYDVEVWRMGNVKDGKVTASLYRYGRRIAMSALPAAFPVGDGVIEVRASSVGLKRCRYIGPGAPPRPLTPHPQSVEGRRARLDTTHPSLSRGIAVASLLMLVVGLGLNLVQLAEIVTGIPAVAARIGNFPSPVHLPVWFNVLLGFGAVLASAERAMRLRYSWLDVGGR